MHLRVQTDCLVLLLPPPDRPGDEGVRPILADGGGRGASPAPSGSGGRGSLPRMEDCGGDDPVDDGNGEESRTVVTERDTDFRAVLQLIRNTNGIEEKVEKVRKRPRNQLQKLLPIEEGSRSSLSLPPSLLFHDVSDDASSSLEKLHAELSRKSSLQTPHPSDRKYYHTDPLLLDVPFTIPSGMAALTQKDVSELKKLSVSLTHSQEASLERVLASVVEASSWMDWWVATCSHWRAYVPAEEQASFDRFLGSGSKAVEFMASHSFTALTNLVLARRDSVLTCVRSSVPQDSLSALRNAPLASSSSHLFPSRLVQEAVDKARASDSDTLIQRTLTSARIPKISGRGGGGSSGTSGSAGPSGVGTPVVPRNQKAQSSLPSTSSLGRGQKGKSDGAPFSGTSRPPKGGKGKGGRNKRGK